MKENFPLLRVTVLLLALGPCSHSAAVGSPADSSLETANHRAGYGLVQFEGESLGGPHVTFGGPGEQPAAPVRRRRRRRPRVQPLPALNELEALVRADHLQCVPRLLCEAVDAAAPDALRRAAAAVVPLLEMVPDEGLVRLARAAVLGAGRGEACGGRYPACPRDSAQLQLYLNNHRGGLFRLFSAPGHSFYSPDAAHSTPGPDQPSYKANGDSQTNIERRILNNSPNHVGLEKKPPEDVGTYSFNREAVKRLRFPLERAGFRFRFPDPGDDSAGGVADAGGVELVYVVRDDPRYPEVHLLQSRQKLR